MKQIKSALIILFLLACIAPFVKADIWQASYSVDFQHGDNDALLEIPIHILFKGRTSSTNWTTISDMVVNTGQTTLSFSTEQYSDTMFEITNPAGWSSIGVMIGSTVSPIQTCTASLDKTVFTCLNISSAGSKNQNIRWRFAPNPTNTPLPSIIPTPTIIACQTNTTIKTCDENPGRCAWFACAGGGVGGCFNVGIGIEVACPSPTPGPQADADGDGAVDDNDYVIMQSHFLQGGSGLSSIGDFNHNGKVDGIDYVIWMKSAKK